MALRTLLTVSLLFHVHAESGLKTTGTPSSSNTGENSTACPCPSAAPPNASGPEPCPSRPEPVLSLLRVTWTSRCKGNVDLSFQPFSNSSPVCFKSKANIESLLRNVCEKRNGCKNILSWSTGKEQEGYNIRKDGTPSNTTCVTMMVQCPVDVSPTPADVLSDVQAELRAYKVVTALLCCVLLVLVLIRFTRPTVSALQKRLSDRRQNRWIGPTQSHSVSYHRGKTGLKNNEEREKGPSYPALERLTVRDSRELSSSF